jgi:hypothetical protein
MNLAIRQGEGRLTSLPIEDVSRQISRSMNECHLGQRDAPAATKRSAPR